MKRVAILPSALMDIAKMQFFYENIEEGLGVRFRAYPVEEIDKLPDHAGIDEMHFGYYRALANRFHRGSPKKRRSGRWGVESRRREELQTF